MESIDFMRLQGKFFACVCIAACAVIAIGVAGQDPPAPASKPKAPPPAGDAKTRINIEVTGGEKSIRVENASEYVKLIEGRTRRKDKKMEMNVKTSRDGIAHVP